MRAKILTHREIVLLGVLEMVVKGVKVLMGLGYA